MGPIENHWHVLEIKIVSAKWVMTVHVCLDMEQ